MLWIENYLTFAMPSHIASAFFGRAVMIPVIVFILFMEFPWKRGVHSSTASLLRPTRTDWWDIFSVILTFLNGRRIVANFIFLGLFTFLARKTQSFPLVETHLPFAVQLVLALIFNDFLTYWSHRLKHENSWLWHVHEFHHSASKLTLWTSFRIHPLDYVVTIPLTVLVPGIFFSWDVLDYSLYFVIKEIPGYVGHSRVDSDFGWFGRYVFVSPRFHHLHHEKTGTTQKNYGNGLVIWDRLFGTYEAPSKAIDTLNPGLLNNEYETHSPFRAYLLPVWRFYQTPVQWILRQKK